MALAKQTTAPLTVEQVVQEVKAELGQPTNLPLTRKIDRLRQMQYDLRNSPTTGNFQVIKRIIYKLNFFIVVRLLSISDGMVSLIDELYSDVNRRVALQEMQIAQMQRDLQEVKHSETGVIRIGQKELQTCTYQGVTLWVRTHDPSDKITAKEVHEHYLPQLIDYAHLQNVIDIGGHIGSFTAYVKHNSPQATVHTIELDLENFTLLRLNVGNLPGVHIYNAACSYQPTGQTITLEALMPLDQIDLLKIDCEGCEHDVLTHCDDATLARIRAIVGEYHGALDVFRSEIMGRLSRWFEIAHLVEGPGQSVFCLLRKQVA